MITMRTPLPLKRMFLPFAAAATFTCNVWAGGDLVKFAENHSKGVLYTTVHRGNVKEEIFTSRATIDAVKSGRPIPSGSVITLVDYRSGELYRYVVMEERMGWGAEYPPEERNG